MQCKAQRPDAQIPTLSKTDLLPPADISDPLILKGRYTITIATDIKLENAIKAQKDEYLHEKNQDIIRSL